jgi:hypothetical protein
MSQFRKALPQLSGDFFLTDGGIETTLIFLEGQELPDFAAFPEGVLTHSCYGRAAIHQAHFYITLYYMGSLSC